MPKKQTEAIISFEQSFEKLAESADALKNEAVTLAESLQYFEEGIKYYNTCNEILKNAKQKVLKFDKNTNITEEME